MQNLPIQAAPVISSVLALLVAFLLALPIAWNREQGRRRMGLRTFPLVAMASCGYVLIGLAIGAAVALDRHELAIAIAVMTFLVFLLLTPVRDRMKHETDEA